MIFAGVVWTALLVNTAGASYLTQSWSDETTVHVTYPEPGNPSRDAHLASPDVISLNDGRLFLCYLEHNSLGTAYINYRISEDDGASWKPPRVIPSTVNGLDPTAAQLPNGQVIVTYAHYKDGPGNVAVNVVKSTNIEEDSWGAPVEIVAPEVETYQGSNQYDYNAFVPSVEVRNNNEVLIAYSWGYEQDYSDLYLIKSTDGGNSWGSPSLIYAHPNVEYYDSKASLIELDNGDLICAFYTTPPFEFNSSDRRNADIYMLRSSDDGQSWGDFTTISAEQNRDECWVSLLQSNSGELYAALTLDEGPKEPNLVPSIKIIKSSDRGATWGNAEIWSSADRRTWPTMANKSDGSILIIADDNGWFNWQQKAEFKLMQRDTLVPIVIEKPELLTETNDLMFAATSSSLTDSVEFYLDGDDANKLPTQRDYETAPMVFTANLPANISPGIHTVHAIAYDGNNFNVSNVDFAIESVAYGLEGTRWASYSDYRAGWLSADYLVANNTGTEVGVTVSDVAVNNRVQLLTELPFEVSAALPAGMNEPFTFKYEVPPGVSSFLNTVFLELTYPNGAEVAMLPEEYVTNLPGEQDEPDPPHTYYFSFYDNNSAWGMNGDWIMITNTADTTATADIYLDDMNTPVTTKTIGAGTTTNWVAPSGTTKGPVKVVSRGDQELSVSQRVQYKSSSVNEVGALDAGKLSSKYYYPWYDGAYFNDWVIVTNPSTDSPVYYEIKVAGVLRSWGMINPGEQVTPTFSGIYGGPVTVEAWTSSVKTAPANIATSQRVIYNNDSFSEINGTPASELASIYYWPKYDNVTASDWVIVANPNPSPIYYELRAQGSMISSGNIAAGGVAAPAVGGVNAANVELKTWTSPTKITPATSVVSQRIISGPSFEEIPGISAGLASSHYYWNWYDQVTSGMYDWVSLVNHQSPYTVNAEVWIGGTLKAIHYLSPGELEYSYYGGLMDGPVEVRAYRNGGSWFNPADRIPIVASQSILWNGYYNEMTGFAPSG